jgi:small-conductance mechanosensitive channel
MASASTDQELAKIGSAAAEIEQRADAALTAQSLAYAGVAERLRRFSEWRYRRLSAAERRDEAALLAKRQALDAAIAPTRAAAAKAGRLYSLVAQRRRESFSARVLERFPSPLTPAFWTSLAAAAGDDLARTLALVSRSLGVAVRAPFPRAPLGLGASLLLAVMIAGPVRLWLESFARRAGPRKTPPGPARRTLRAILIALVDVGAPSLAAALVRVGAEWGDLLSASADALAASLVAAVAWGSAIVALGRVLATDKDPDLRLIALTDPEAARIRRALWAVAFVTASGFVVHQISFTVGASLPASIAATSTLALAYAAAAGFTLMSAGPRGVGEAGSRDALKASTAWTLISVPVALSIVATVASVLLGFVTLASLISGQMFWLSLIAAVTYLLVTLIDDLFTALFDPSGSSVRALTVHLGLRSSTVAQAGLLVSAALQITVLLAAIALALTPYGQSGELLLAHARELGGPIHLGKATISPSAVIAGLATFAIGMALAHGARGWVTRRYLPITTWDAGLKNSVSTGIGYVGAGIALLSAFAVMGLSFQQIALIASALSVGIGFGLQQIVQNFVAGVILLIERPVKIGDWVNVGGVEGDVRRIRVRATEIQSFDRSTIIVPNSNLITMNVQNKTLGDERGRIQLQFTIAKPADARKTADLVRDAARAREEILRDPERSCFRSSRTCRRRRSPCSRAGAGWSDPIQPA